MEIEKKWLVSGWPQGLVPEKELHMEQGYVSVNPTVRYRREGEACVLCFKSAGTLSRKELELPLTDEAFREIEAFTGLPTVPKTHRRYPLPHGLTLEVNLVDEGAPTEFWYAEIEFETIEQANTFTPDSCGLEAYLKTDVTETPGFSMGAYWEKTRLRAK